MRRSMLLVSALVGAVVLVSAASGSAGSMQARWVITDLGTLGGPRSNAVAINDGGQVVGESEVSGTVDTSNDSHPFLWEKGKLRDLGVLPRYSDCWVTGVSEVGQVIGYCSRAEGEMQMAFLWSRGRMTSLGTLGGKSSRARGINDRGQVVGDSGTGTGRTHAFLWQAGKMRDLGVLPGGNNSTAVAINERGQVIGSGDGKGGSGRAFLWWDGRMTDLGVLAGGKQSKAVAVNDEGQVIAYSWFTKYDPNGEEHYNADFPRAFLWQAGRRIALAGLPGRPYTIPAAIGNGGEVVGQSYDREGLYWVGSTSVAFRWVNGRMQALPSLRGGETSATDINASGRIVGDSSSNTILTNAQRAVVWTNGKLTNLGVLRRSDPESWAVAINQHGTILGQSGNRGIDYETPTHAVLWTLRSG